MLLMSQLECVLLFGPFSPLGFVDSLTVSSYLRSVLLLRLEVADAPAAMNKVASSLSVNLKWSGGAFVDLRAESYGA